MGLQVQVTGGRDLAAVSRRLREVGNKGLGRQMAKQLREASDELRPAVTESAQRLMPRRGGYAELLSTSLRYRQSVQHARTTARVLFRIHADGRRERRDVPSINRGQLRKPLFGDRDRWFDQRVKVGFVDRPVDQLQPDIARRMQSVVDDFAAQIGA
jgi:hypothetical protein